MNTPEIQGNQRDISFRNSAIKPPSEHSNRKITSKEEELDIR